ncbi:DUF962-domain-containing protein [Auricularia subglabra TFB-10046 SS5]|nr:DUF962-domain-containing protein [Auricularia subglabra TFB-10046 SS5]
MTKVFDVEHQLVFYGAYHNNKVNFLIHVFGVPLLFWSGAVFASSLPWPDAFPQVAPVQLAPYLTASLNWGAVLCAAYWTYYFILEPLTATLYFPQLVLTYLFAEGVAATPGGLKIAAYVHIVSWIAQFVGHGAFERRAPALLDNLLGALVLAPFFVHLELLFTLGYKPELHRRMTNGVGREITKFRTDAAQKKRAEVKKDL